MNKADQDILLKTLREMPNKMKTLTSTSALINGVFVAKDQIADANPYIDDEAGLSGVIVDLKNGNQKKIKGITIESFFNRIEGKDV